MKNFKVIIGVIIIFVIVYFIYYFFSGMAYSDQYWKYRKTSTTIDESIRRGVFVKKLHHRVDSFSGYPFHFEAFIEKAFTYGRQSIQQTVPVSGTNYPYRLSFNYKPAQNLWVSIRPDQLNKFDSSNANWGFLKKPELTDTIILVIKGDGSDYGFIKVW